MQCNTAFICDRQYDLCLAMIFHLFICCVLLFYAFFSLYFIFVIASSFGVGQ